MAKEARPFPNSAYASKAKSIDHSSAIKSSGSKRQSAGIPACTDKPSVDVMGMRLLLGVDEKTCSLALALLLTACFLMWHSHLAPFKMEVCLHYLGMLCVP